MLIDYFKTILSSKTLNIMIYALPIRKKMLLVRRKAQGPAFQMDRRQVCYGLGYRCCRSVYCNLWLNTFLSNFTIMTVTLSVVELSIANWHNFFAAACGSALSLSLSNKFWTNLQASFLVGNHIPNTVTRYDQEFVFRCDFSSSREWSSNDDIFHIRVS